MEQLTLTPSQTEIIQRMRDGQILRVSSDKKECYTTRQDGYRDYHVPIFFKRLLRANLIVAMPYTKMDLAMRYNRRYELTELGKTINID